MDFAWPPSKPLEFWDENWLVESHSYEHEEGYLVSKDGYVSQACVSIKSVVIEVVFLSRPNEDNRQVKKINNVHKNQVTRVF